MGSKRVRKGTAATAVQKAPSRLVQFTRDHADLSTPELNFRVGLLHTQIGAAEMQRSQSQDNLNSSRRTLRRLGEEMGSLQALLEGRRR